jgi:oligopeptide/dipeptide ABC transporter ATP-binding protein
MIERFEMALLFITHNLGVVAHMCDTIGVMYASHLVELTDTKTLFAEPLHPYTWGLLNSIPRVETRHRYLNPIQGTICNMLAPPTGCNFHPRCERAMDICRREVPPLRGWPRVTGCVPLAEGREFGIFGTGSRGDALTLFSPGVTELTKHYPIRNDCSRV